MLHGAAGPAPQAMPLTRAVAAAIVCWSIVQPAPVAFTTIDRGAQSAIEEPRQAVARTALEWAALWKEHAGPAKPPAVDPSRSMVIAVFLGTRPTAGHGVEITRIEKRGAELVVSYREQAPGADEMVAQVLTAPFHIVRTASDAARVRFERAR
jgi:hypothetical protein